MTDTELKYELDEASGGVRLSMNGLDAVIHPLWLRERVVDADMLDPTSHQRTYETCALPQDLKITTALPDGDDLKLSFSDGSQHTVSQNEIAMEMGWVKNPQTPPVPEPWTASLNQRPIVDWADIQSPGGTRKFLEGFFKFGFSIIRNTPTQMESLSEIASRFGFIRETNFNKIFDVVTKPNPVDLAYTGLPLAGHTDNPYRKPVPCIQFLHCLKNEVGGGLNTLVDGLSIVEQLRKENPEALDILATTPLRFRYETELSVMEAERPMIEFDHAGDVKAIHISPRLDYVPLADPDTLTKFYAARKRALEIARDPAFEIRYTFEPGVLLMMDNYRLLHGRTAFNAQTGHRHLRGCYIDHDGPDSLYRMLMRDGKTISLPREASYA